MSWELTVVPDTYPALNYAGIVIPGEGCAPPPARQLAVLRAYSTGNNRPEAIATELSLHGGLPDFTPDEAREGLRAATDFYGSAGPAQAVCAAIEQHGHLSVQPDSPDVARSWDERAAPRAVRTALTYIADGQEAILNSSLEDALLGFFGANGLGAAVRRAHELGYRKVPPRRAVFALPPQQNGRQPDDMLSPDERMLLQAHLTQTSTDRTVDALSAMPGAPAPTRDQLKRLLAMPRSAERFDAGDITELITKAYVVGALKIEPNAGLEVDEGLRTAHRLRILANAACGLTNGQIARRVGLTFDAVKSSISSGMKMLGIERRNRLMPAGLRAGIFVVGRFAKQ
ncbi:MAG TPA: hypothetical protein VLF71_02430 [Candidatus Saccharimonadales bacterium]|nr:hypothetical protein [Candidatus Saccharimonadales bacterium]